MKVFVIFMVAGEDCIKTYYEVIKIFSSHELAVNFLDQSGFKKNANLELWVDDDGDEYHIGEHEVDPV